MCINLVPESVTAIRKSSETMIYWITNMEQITSSGQRVCAASKLLALSGGGMAAGFKARCALKSDELD